MEALLTTQGLQFRLKEKGSICKINADTVEALFTRQGLQFRLKEKGSIARFPFCFIFCRHSRVLLFSNDCHLWWKLVKKIEEPTEAMKVPKGHFSFFVKSDFVFLSFRKSKFGSRN